MASEMKWFRLYSEIVHDPKVRRLKDAAKFGILVGLLALAGESKVRGWVCIDEDMPYELDELAEILMATEDKISETISELQKLRIIQMGEDGIIKFANWEKRQYDKPSDSPEAVKERVKRHREKKKSVSTNECNADVTPLKRQSNAIYTETDTERDTDNKSNTSNNSSLLSKEGGFGGKQTTSGDIIEIEGQIEFLKIFEQEFGRKLTPMERQSIIDIAKNYSPDFILKALKEAVIKQKMSISYVLGILKDWEINNLKTLTDIENYEKSFTLSRKNYAKSKSKDPKVRAPAVADKKKEMLMRSMYS